MQFYILTANITKRSYVFIIYLFIQHLYSALFTNKYALMRLKKYCKNALAALHTFKISPKICTVCQLLSQQYEIYDISIKTCDKAYSSDIVYMYCSGVCN